MKTLMFFLFAIVANCNAQVDQTLVPMATGAAVVEAVVSIIQETCIFEDDKLFLRRMAYVESQDGTWVNTFAAGNYGGIWQIDYSKFVLTQSVSSPILSQIQSEFGINWLAVTWNDDLLKPLYSGLAARLYIQYKKQVSSLNIPSSLSDQGIFWATHITSSGSSAATFVSLSNQITSICDIVADIAFLLDGSGSISPTEYAKVKNFVQQVIPDFNVGPDALLHSRVSLTVYSNRYGYNVLPQFDFDDYSSAAAYVTAVNTIAHPQGGTPTDLGLDALTTSTFLASKGARSTIPDIAIVVTDGVSNDHGDTLTSAANLLATGVTTFAVGIGLGGSATAMEELEAIASDPNCNHLFNLANFNEFDAFVKQIEKRVCDVPTRLNGTTTVVLITNQIRYFTYTLTSICQVVEISTTNGDADVYYALAYQPNSARYDGYQVVTPTTPMFVYTTLTSGIVRITVVARSDVRVTFEFVQQTCHCPGCLVPVPWAINFHLCLDTDHQTITTTKTTTTTTRSTGNGYDCTIGSNPCYPSIIIPHRYYYTYTHSIYKFVQCDAFGGCFVRPCAPGTKWNDPIQVCSW